MFIPKSFILLKNYNVKTFTQDLFAGITVGVVALPLAMAFAIASGVSPEKGLYTAIVAGFLISLLGGSRVQIGGPTGAFVVLVNSILLAHGYDGLVLATFLAGIFLIIMGLARFGGMIKFIPFPVITGFTSGIAVVIFSTQIKDLLGLQMEKVPAEFFEKWEAYFHHIRTINFSAAGLSAATIAVILIVRRFFPRVPAMLVALIVVTVASHGLNLPVDTIGSRFGQLPDSLPAVKMPAITLARLQELLSPALTVALLGAIESLLSATVADGMMGTRHKSNMELVGQGVANIGSALFGGIPATGAIARTATNVKSGAKTPVAGMIHAVVLLLILIFLSPLARHIPLACLAGILVIVSYQMSEIKHFRQLLSAPRSDVAVLLITFVLTVVVDLTVAVQVGVVLAALLFIRRMAEFTNIAAITGEQAEDDNGEDARPAMPEGVEVYEIAGPLFFGAAEKFKDALRIAGRRPERLILEMTKVPMIDATGLNALRELISQSGREGIRVMIVSPNAMLNSALKKAGIGDISGFEGIKPSLGEAIK